MMSQNEAWATMVAGINCLDVSPTETIAVIQLDAFKAGAEWAAKIAEKVSDEVCHEDPFAHQDIRDALVNLKELPK